MSKITNVIRQFKRHMQSELPDLYIVLTPHTYTLSEGDVPLLPSLVIQGPEIQRYERNYEIKSQRTGESSGVETRQIVKARVELNLIFRIRLFTNTLLDALKYMEELLKISTEFIDIDTQIVTDLNTFSGNNPVNIEVAAHGLRSEDIVIVTNSTNTASLPNGIYNVIEVDLNTIAVDFNGNGAGGTCSVTRYEGMHDVYIDENFTDESVPNFSDVKHFETTASIEGIVIETDEKGNVKVAQEELNIVEEKI